MTVSGVTSSTETSSTESTSKSASASKSLASTYDTFLTMLTTQLKNQDPLSPMDSTEFTSQLVQFSAVEQQINANSNLEKLITLNQQNQVSSAISYIGNTIEVDGSSVPLQDGSGSFSYTLGDEAKSASILIKDDSGKVVRTLTADTTAGRHEVTWDGKDTNGEQLEDGKYTISVAALDSEGASMEVATTVYGRVTDVAVDDTDGTMLAMGGVVTTVDKVLTVSEGKTTASN